MFNMSCDDISIELPFQVVPGETALAFYTAENPSDQPIAGISTYNVVPFDAGQYFNKIQCFCFEEQQLNPHEQVCCPYYVIFIALIMSNDNCRWICQYFST